MQDVTGRFIANAAKQLRKRAASLCLEELKEYKVSPCIVRVSPYAPCYDCCWCQSMLHMLQRSKVLNILQAPVQTQGSGSRPSSASYLIPAVPVGLDMAARSDCKSDHAQPPSSQSIPVMGDHHELGAPASQVEGNLEMQPQLASAAHQNGTDASAQIQASLQALPSKQMDMGSTSLLTAPTQVSASHMQLGARTSRATASIHSLPATSAMDFPSCNPSASDLKRCDSEQTHSDAGKQQWLPVSNHAFMTSWSRGTAQPVQTSERWTHGPSQPALHYSPATLGCAHSFPFGKQPCPVLW